MERNLSYRDDSDLLERVAAGDEGAFRVVYDRWLDRLYLTALKMTKSPLQSEEIVQEVFIKLWMNRAKLREVEKLDAWLHRILYNHIHDYLSKESNQERLVRDAARSREYKAVTTEEMVDLRQSEQRLEEAIRTLSPQQQLVYRMSEQQGLDHQTISEQLHISPNTVRVHLQRAKEAIRLYLKDLATVIALLASFRHGGPSL